MDEIVSFFSNWGVWAWLSIGVLLMIAELFVPGVFVMWFGFGAVLTGIITGVVGGLSVAMQLLIFVIMSVISLGLGLFVYGKIFGPNKEKGNDTRTGAQRLIGKSFIVSETIQNGKGKVTVGDTVWLARSKRKIAKGAEVVVIGAEGTQLLVEEKK